MRPKGRLILKMNSIYDVPKIDVLFDDWYTNSVWLWPKTEIAPKYFLRNERTPINSPFDSENSNISLDIVHQKMIAKNLMCPCYNKNAHDEGNSYVKNLYHFYCKCKDDHKHFVHNCKYHRYISKMQSR